MAMNENAKKWVAALRSGKYKQGKFVLHQVDTDSYCCLGLACHLAAESGVTMEIAIRDVAGHYTGRCTYFHGRNTGLPDGVRRWLGLSDAMGRFDSDSLAGMNDNGSSFEEIASTIESEPYGLFVSQPTHGGEK